MPAPLLGLPALLQAIATVGVGGAIGYKAQKDLQPYIKELKKSPEDMDTPQLKMLRALLLPNQALASKLKDMTTSKSVGLTGEGYDIGPRVEDIEREQEEIRQVTKPGVSKPAVEPITKETFPAEPEQKPEPPIQPEIQLEKKETFPDLSEEINIPIINYSKDVPKDFKDLAKRSVGKDKGTEAVDAIFDDEMLLDVLDKNQIQRIRQLEDQYVGDIMDRGDPSVPLAFTNSMVSQYEDYFEDYKQKLADVAEEKLGSEFPMFRLMRKDDALKMLKDQQLPNIKVENEAGEIVPFTMNVFGEDVPQLQENMSFSLNPRTALSFKEIFESDKPDEDYVLLEYKASPSDIVMRGHQAEADLVLNMSEAVNSPSSFKVYDFKYIKDGDLIKGLNVSANKEFDEFIGGKEENKLKEIIDERNKFWEKSYERANKNFPEFRVENLKKIVEADKHFGAAAYSFQDFDDSKLIYLSPDDYLNLTKKFRPKDFDKNLNSKVNIQNIENLLKENKELANIPMLYVKKKGDSFVVSGQEGNHRAQAFKNLGYDKIPVVIEGSTKKDREETKNIFPSSIQSNDGAVILTKPEDFYDVISKEKLFKKEQPQAPAIVGTKAQEGGKQIKDITAGFSIQKDIVPSLLEQGKAATPMKNFFEKDTNVINYKVGDTIGAYGGDVERSLDIEANVKPNFNIDSFSEVIKQGAKEYNQDAVFVAESAPPEKANTVGFSIDFGSNLNIADALEVSKRISDTAQLDGFTFKVKNLDTSGASIYLPQEKDLEMTQKVIDKFQPTDQINLAGFMMPDGRMLNFSRSGNVRDTEHRRIGLTTHPGSDGISFGPMYDFMNKTGAIRLAGNTNRLYAEISGKPSVTQIRKIAEEYNKNRDRYDSLTIALAIPKTEGALGGVKPEEAIDLNKMAYRLPNEAFIEINGTEANANDIFKKFQAADVMGKTFTGIRQLNIPEFSGMSPKDAARKIVNLGNNMSKIIEETGIKTLDKPKTKSYNVKLFQKGKDY